MPPKFGTSGLRGLVTELTDDLIRAHVQAFLTACDVGAHLCVGRDLRASSPHLADMVTQAARTMGVAVTDCGVLPTPALALAALKAGCGAIMVTGSHIPDDRNGLKFYSTQGEITKIDEAAILAALGKTPPRAAPPAALHQDSDALPRFHARYVSAFGPGVLDGARVGVWSHSSVGRDLMLALLRDLGAQVTELGRSDRFIPVDTEAVDATTRAQLRDWAAGGAFDAIVSADGDADRPLLTDARGTIVPGDILGQITARFVDAEVAVTPVSSNSGIELGGQVDVVRTRIGSPYVIAALAAQAPRRSVGYEANGGFLLGFDASVPAPLPALVTRDCILPILATLVAARTPGGAFDVARLVAGEPARFTAADRLEEIPVTTSARVLTYLLDDMDARAALLGALGLSEDHTIDTIDGLRMTDAGGTVIHLRPSGNAPEFRVYVEAETPARATALLTTAFGHVNALCTTD